MTSRVGAPIWATLAAMSVLAVACASRPEGSPPPDPLPEDVSDPYVIGANDKLLINVWQNDAATVEVPVRPDGKVSIPLIGDVHAQGRTPEALKEEIVRELSKLLETPPDVAVIVSEMNSSFVSVVGQVSKTCRLPLNGDLRVVEAIALADGFDVFADRSDVRIIRRMPDGTEVEYHFDYDAYMRGAAPGSNFLLRSGDIVFVPE